MPDFETHPIGAAAEPDLLQAERADALSAAFAWKRMAWELRSYAVHDDDCKINRAPDYRACSCGLTARLSRMDEMEGEE